MNTVCPSCGSAGRPWVSRFPFLGSVSHHCNDGLNTKIPGFCICSSSIEDPLVGRKSLGLQAWAQDSDALNPFLETLTWGAGWLSFYFWRTEPALQAFPETRPWTAAKYS